MLSLMSWGTTESDGLLDDVWDAADLQVRNLDKALFACYQLQPLLFTCFLLSSRGTVVYLYTITVARYGGGFMAIQPGG